MLKGTIVSDERARKGGVEMQVSLIMPLLGQDLNSMNLELLSFARATR